MWRRICVAPLRSALRQPRASSGPASSHSGSVLAPVSASSSFLDTRYSFSSVPEDGSSRNKVEDVMPVVTGLERVELEAERQGKKLFEMETPVGPFGTKEAPAVIQSHYNMRIVGCVGDEGEDEHEVMWFWLKKDKPHVCPICSQYFVLEVIGKGGDPYPPSDDDDH
ncbi:putative cytochrome c oxidase subunit 5b-like [Zingiber officinale]|uniref:Cytochrome c oxidase subunit Vb n=1 Tax=Zingiber officinale TaxID=94328 RepID=A0A8J5LV25_ZINOF|nr:putative cytochrome c oxidase subunit 5b-like [Zingiber officinale]KAG6526274.1 hypothetical protein ZIOFF_016256 [Zingiber officinale]